MNQSLPGPQPTPPPLPPIPLTYARGSSAPRTPGLVIALGVISIIIGIGGVILGGVSVYAALVSHVPTALRFPGRPSLPYNGDAFGERGLAKAERRIVVDTLARRLNLPAHRQRMLDRLLAEEGRAIFPMPANVTPAQVEAAIRASGQAPIGPDGSRSMGTHYFVTDKVRVLINNRDARLAHISSNHSTTIREDVVVYSYPDHVCSTAIAEWLDDQRRTLGPSFTAKQASALLAMVRERHPPPLSDENNRFIGIPLESRGRYLRLQTGLRPTFLLANGSTWTDERTIDPDTGLFAPPRPDERDRAGYRVTSILSVLLAIALILGGLQILMGRPHGLATLAGWWPVKLGVTVLTAGYSIMVVELAPSHHVPVAFLVSLGLLALGCIYSIVVAIVLRTRVVRAHWLMLTAGTPSTVRAQRIVQMTVMFAAPILMVLAALPLFSNSRWNERVFLVIVIVAGAAALLQAVLVQRRLQSRAVDEAQGSRIFSRPSVLSLLLIGVVVTTLDAAPGRPAVANRPIPASRPSRARSVAEGLTSSDPVAKAEALSLLGKIGALTSEPDAIEALLRHDDPAVRKTVLDAVERKTGQGALSFTALQALAKFAAATQGQDRDRVGRITMQVLDKWPEGWHILTDPAEMHMRPWPRQELMELLAGMDHRPNPRISPLPSLAPVDWSVSPPPPAGPSALSLNLMAIVRWSLIPLAGLLFAARALRGPAAPDPSPGSTVPNRAAFPDPRE